MQDACTNIDTTVLASLCDSCCETTLPTKLFANGTVVSSGCQTDYAIGSSLEQSTETDINMNHSLSGDNYGESVTEQRNRKSLFPNGGNHRWHDQKVTRRRSHEDLLRNEDVSSLNSASFDRTEGCMSDSKTGPFIRSKDRVSSADGDRVLKQDGSSFTFHHSKVGFSSEKYNSKHVFVNQRRESSHESLTLGSKKSRGLSNAGQRSMSCSEAEISSTKGSHAARGHGIHGGERFSCEGEQNMSRQRADKGTYEMPDTLDGPLMDEDIPGELKDNPSRGLELSEEPEVTDFKKDCTCSILQEGSTLCHACRQRVIAKHKEMVLLEENLSEEACDPRGSPFIEAHNFSASPERAKSALIKDIDMDKYVMDYQGSESGLNIDDASHKPHDEALISSDITDQIPSQCWSPDNNEAQDVFLHSSADTSKGASRDLSHGANASQSIYQSHSQTSQWDDMEFCVCDMCTKFNEFKCEPEEASTPARGTVGDDSYQRQDIGSSVGYGSSYGMPDSDLGSEKAETERSMSVFTDSMMRDRVGSYSSRYSMSNHHMSNSQRYMNGGHSESGGSFTENQLFGTQKYGSGKKLWQSCQLTDYEVCKEDTGNSVRYHVSKKLPWNGEVSEGEMSHLTEPVTFKIRKDTGSSSHSSYSSHTVADSQVSKKDDEYFGSKLFSLIRDAQDRKKSHPITTPTPGSPGESVKTGMYFRQYSFDSSLKSQYYHSSSPFASKSSMTGYPATNFLSTKSDHRNQSLFTSYRSDSNRGHLRTSSFDSSRMMSSSETKLTQDENRRRWSGSSLKDFKPQKEAILSKVGTVAESGYLSSGGADDAEDSTGDRQEDIHGESWLDRWRHKYRRMMLQHHHNYISGKRRIRRYLGQKVHHFSGGRAKKSTADSRKMKGASTRKRAEPFVPHPAESLQNVHRQYSAVGHCVEMDHSKPHAAKIPPGASKYAPTLYGFKPKIVATSTHYSRSKRTSESHSGRLRIGKSAQSGKRGKAISKKVVLELQYHADISAPGGTNPTEPMKEYNGRLLVPIVYEYTKEQMPKIVKVGQPTLK